MNRTMKSIAVLMLMMVFAVGCNKPDNGGNNNENEVNDHEFVDLGLPSGTLWATCNVGADTPEDYGDYFAWGESEIKAVYKFVTYKFGNSIDSTLTKYCNNPYYGYNGFSDTLTVLQKDDDVVSIQWGDEWRLPTKKEWEELYQNTNVTWTTQNGVNGRLLTAANGNSLFLPAGGYRGGKCFWKVGSGGYYWSSSLYNDFPYSAYFFGFNYSDYYGWSSTNRYLGQSVRAVRSAN